MHPKFFKESEIPYYNFECLRGHAQEEQLSFSEFKELPEDDKYGKHIPCNVKYGELGNPSCEFDAFQKFGSIGIQMNYGPQGRH